jgi:hypothetical protein
MGKRLKQAMMAVRSCCSFCDAPAMRLLTHAAFRNRAGFVCGDAAAEQGLQPGLHFARAQVRHAELV